MPAGQGNDEETFAAAVELGCPPGPAGDGELSRDLAIVAMLRAGGAAVAPTAEERARSRAAVLARLSAASDPSDHLAARDDARPSAVATAVLPAADGEPADELADARRRRRGRHAMPAEPADLPARRRHTSFSTRLVSSAAAAVLATALLGAGGVLASSGALPGDALYPVKRVAETASLAMTWDDTARGHRHLQLASTRIDEVEQLLAENPETGVEPQVYSTALHDFETEAGEGSRLLLASPDDQRDRTRAALESWAADQADRLAALRGSLPGPAASEAGGSLERLAQLVGPDPLDPAAHCPDPAVPCAPASAPGEVGATATDPTGAGPSTAPSGEPGRGTQPSGTGEPGLLPQVLPGPVGDVLSPDEPSTTTPTDRPQDGSGDGPPPLEVPPLLPGLPGVTVG